MKPQAPPPTPAAPGRSGTPVAPGTPETPEVPTLPDAAPVSVPIAGTKRRATRWWHHLGLGLISLPVLSASLLALMLTLVWGWSGREGSLAQLLQAAIRLPGLGSLQVSQVQGNVREGGRIGRLDWRQPGLQLQLQDLQLRLDWPRLPRGQLPISVLQISRLQAQTTPDASAKTPAPPEQLRLPLQVDLAWQVGLLDVTGATRLQLRDLQGHYRYDHVQHRLDLQRLQLADGRYQGTLVLQARAPMTLSAQLNGEVSTTLPAKTARPVRWQAQASLHGTLAGPDARLALQAELRERSPRAQQPLLLQATLHPWQAQTLHSAQLRLQQLDLAPLWPQAPRTQLDGTIDAAPETPSDTSSDPPSRTSPDAAARPQGWQLQVQLRNSLPGPWDRQRLPVQQLQARLLQQGPVWRLQALQARIGPGGSGLVQAIGEWRDPEPSASARSQWQGQARLQQLTLSHLHSQLEGTTLSGLLDVRPQDASEGPDGIAISADLQPEATLTGPRQPQDHLRLQALWTPQRWQFEQLSLQIGGLQLQGQGSWQTGTLLAQGRWQLQAPGLQARVDGQLGPQQGQGELQIDSDDLARTQAWLQRWPALHAWLHTPALQGQARLQARWDGGWQQDSTRLEATLTSASLASPALGNGRLVALQLTLQGSPVQLQARAEGRWLQAGRSWPFETRLQARALKRDHWQGLWQQARLQIPLQPGASAGTDAAVLTLALQQPVPWQLQSPAGADSPARLRWDAQSWQLRGNDERTARFELDAGAWPLQSDAPLRLRLTDLPVTWSSLLGWPALQGDLLLRGQAELAALAPLQLQARLERQRGDLAVRADLAGQGLLQAGLRNAAADLQVQGPQARLRLDWASAQAGEVQAQVQALAPSPVQAGQGRADAPATWPNWAQAALDGQVQARWPQVGAWSWLAPPGWRAQGSLDARFALGGTLAQPRWDGQLQADQLALRSAVQGVELGQGRLRARLQDQQMVLESLSLRGAGAQGGELLGEGLLQWQNRDAPGDSAGLRGLRAKLTLRAGSLRVSNRADRRLAVSGEVQTTLEQGQLRLRGQLRADQALFVLPEDSTPRLGSDVQVLVDSAGPRPRPASTSSETSSWLATPDVRVSLDLGPDFQLQGQGLRTRLAGSLQLASSAASQGRPRLNGEVRTEGGRYRAYGQQLDIERGVLRFAGPYDNPDLDILALRPQLPQRVGVRITGTAQSPRIRLYADPEMPDADKLAWLVLGRSPAGGGAESALLQQAALALLGGNGSGLSGELAQALGLDTIGLSTPSGENTTGAAITLGKRLSKDFYLAYESSVSGTFGSLFIFYDLSRRLTLRAQAGDLNALDLIYTVRKD